MNQAISDFIFEKTQELIKAPTCSIETKTAAKAWLKSIGTENEGPETQRFIDELEADIMPLDTLISFAESESGAQVFGADASNVAAHAKEIKAAGAIYCDCPACMAAASILEKKAALLA